MPLQYAAVPRTAIKRRREVTKGAYDLFILYCMLRDLNTGRIVATLKELSEEMEVGYTHVSRLKSHLVEKGWIEEAGHDEITIRIGADELPQPKVRPLENFAEKRKESCEKAQTFPAEFAEKRKESCEKAQTFPALSNTELLERKEAAATPPAAPRYDPWKIVCDDGYVDQVRRAGIKPPEVVDYVWTKLKNRCKAEGTDPTRGRFDSWVSKEWKLDPVQLGLLGGSVHDAPVEMGKPKSKSVRPPSPDCELCHGDGKHAGGECVCTFCPHCAGTWMERVGNAMRRCRCRSPGPAPSVEAAEAEGEAVSDGRQQIIGGGQG